MSLSLPLLVHMNQRHTKDIATIILLISLNQSDTFIEFKYP